MDYNELIYGLLQQYLPPIANSLSSISEAVSVISSYAPDLSDIRKFLFWLLIAFLSTKIIRWGYRI